jgi:hypothetical protein
MVRRTGRRDTRHGFAVDADPGSDGLDVDAAEIAQARWFAHDALPSATSEYTRRMVARAYWELFRG